MEDRVRQVLKKRPKKEKAATEPMYQVCTINVQKWRELGEEDKMKMLYDIGKLGAGTKKLTKVKL